MGSLLLISVLLSVVQAVSKDASSFRGTVQPMTDKALQAKREKFFEWCAASGIKSAALEWRQDGVAGSGLFAGEEIGNDSVLGSVPLNVTISMSSLRRVGWVKTMKDNGVDTKHPVMVLALWLLYQRHEDNFKGFAGSYVETLPQDAQWASCMWTSTELRTAQRDHPLLWLDLYADRTVVAMEWNMLSLFMSNQTVWKTPIMASDYCWARTMVSSRWFIVTDAKDTNDHVEFKVQDGYAYASVRNSATAYQENHLVPYLDLFNHDVISSGKEDAFFREVSVWKLDPALKFFRMNTSAEGARRPGEEVFISYGSPGIDEALVHYGFLLSIPHQYYYTTIDLSVPNDDPLREEKLRGIATCWPDFTQDHIKVLPENLPVEIFQRAQLTMERRASRVATPEAVQKNFCKTSRIFNRRDIESLRRNKRAMLYILRRLEEAWARSPSREWNEKQLAVPGISYNMRNLIRYRQITRDNLEMALRSYRQGNWKLLKQIHLTGHT